MKYIYLLSFLSSWCTTLPSTCMALKGLTGHTYSQAPQPRQRSSLTEGVLGPSGSNSFGTIRMAPAGQWRAQLPQLSPLAVTQVHISTTAWPTCMALFSSRLIFNMAPAGHTSEQRVHSGRHQPLSKESSGCIRFSSEDEGRSTSLGHTLTQSWQEMQCLAILSRLTEPGGVMRVSRFGLCFATTGARPPSPPKSWALSRAEPATRAVALRKARLVLSGPASFAGLTVSAALFAVAAALAGLRP